VSKGERHWRPSRRLNVPHNWLDLSREALDRADFVCELRLHGCRMGASDVLPLVRSEPSQPENYDLANLVAVCVSCAVQKLHADELQAIAEHGGPPEPLPPPPQLF
jgi:hypothetical protein